MVSPPTQLKDLQGHGEPGFLGAHQRPVAGAEVLTGRQQQQHGHVVSKLQQFTGVNAILIRLSHIHTKKKNLLQASSCPPLSKLLR